MNSHQTGITLVSILVATSILVTLFSLAAPPLSQFLSNSKSVSASAIIHRSLNNARTLAIKREEPITVCGVDSEKKCKTTNFNELVLFADTDRNAVIDEEETVFYSSKIDYRGSVRLRASLRSKFIRFKVTGGSEQAGSFIYCEPGNPQTANRVTVSITGRSYLGVDNDNDGIVEDTSGGAIEC